MPFRAELKRPDLKGHFPCTVCGKIFCHSSSLSRHRMQAHFKSYTCTLCNTEISSNETLRSHMFRSHDISRMFMCRCCNWAFPDKTSLHIHMQSMMRHGQPGDVNILAKSSTEGGPSPIPGSPITANSSMLLDPGTTPSPVNASFGNFFGGKTSPFSGSPSLVPPSSSANGIFPSMPAMPSREELLNRLRARAAGMQAMESMQQGQKPEQQSSPLTGINAVSNQLQAALLAASQAQQSAASSSNSNNHTSSPLSSMANTSGSSVASALNQQNLLAAWLQNNFRNFGAPPSASDSPKRNCGLDSPPLNGEEAAEDGMKQEKMEDDSGDDAVEGGFDDYDVIENGNSDTGEVKVTDDPENQNETNGPDTQDPILNNEEETLPILRRTIMANPLQSLMYGKKLNNVLRNRNLAGERNSFSNFLVSPQDGTAAFHNGNGTQGRRSGDELVLNHPQASPAASDSQTSSTGAPLSAGSDGSSPQKCFECQVTKGKLNLAENRNKFLENKVSSLENKIARMESRIAGLESNSRRYEGEHRVMREQCDGLEKKLLSCQEKALRYMQESGNNNVDNIKLMKDLLDDLLQIPTNGLSHNV